MSGGKRTADPAQAFEGRIVAGKARESDHEFVPLMAVEEGAKYVPGKADAAERGRRETPCAITLDLSEDQLLQLDTALPDAIELIEDAGATLGFLANMISCGYMAGAEPGAMSVMRLSSRALLLAGERELPALDMLDARLRAARKATPKGGTA